MSHKEQETLSLAKKYKRKSGFQEVAHRLSKNTGAMIGLAIVLTFFILAFTASLWIDYDTQVIAQNMSEANQWPSAEHIMGTDRFGRDICYRLIYGSRFSLSVGFVAVIIAMVLGLPIGGAAGYFGGDVDNIILRLTDIFSAVPQLLMGIVLVSAFGTSLFSLMLAIGISSVPGFILGTRNAVLTVRHQEFIESARAIGMSTPKIIFGQVLPNCFSQIMVRVSMRIGSAVISSSSLSFLGLGVPAPAPEWGSMLSAGRKFIRDYSYMTMFPGIAIMLLVISFNMLGDGLRDAMDPKLKK